MILFISIIAVWLLLGVAFYYPARLLWIRRSGSREFMPGWGFALFGPCAFGGLLFELIELVRQR
jgi:hypothetical protein